MSGRRLPTRNNQRLHLWLTTRCVRSRVRTPPTGSTFIRSQTGFFYFIIIFFWCLCHDLCFQRYSHICLSICVRGVSNHLWLRKFKITSCLLRSVTVSSLSSLGGKRPLCSLLAELAFHFYAVCAPPRPTCRYLKHTGDGAVWQRSITAEPKVRHQIKPPGFRTNSSPSSALCKVFCGPKND